MLQSPGKENLSTCKSSFWGICCESGKKYSQVVRQKFHISMAALHPIVKPTSPCVSLIVERGGSQYLLCSLKPESLLQVNLNLFFDKGEKVAFYLKGHGRVDLSGYHIYDESDDLNSSKNSNSGTIQSNEKQNQFQVSLKKDSKKAKSGKVKSNVDMYEVNKDKESKEEKKVGSPAKAGTTPVKKNAKPVESESDESSSDAPVKKNAKSVEPESDESSSDEDISSHDEDAKAILRFAKKRTHASMEEDDDDDSDADLEDDSDEDDSDEDDDIDSDEEPPKKTPSKVLQNNKKLKASSSTPLPGKKAALTTPNIATEVIDLEPGDSKKGAFPKLNDPNSSIGRTPMPKKTMPSTVQQSNSFNDSLLKTLSKADESSESDSDDEMEVSTNKISGSDKNKSNSEASAVEMPSSKKKKKKKKAKAASADTSALNQSNASVKEESNSNLNQSKVQYNRKLPGGIEYEDIRIGNGPIAKKGKLAHVYYTGKLENNKVFDSCQTGRKPFSFKVGSGQVIRGWDLGIEGMKVGGKRRLKIPPQMGYKSQRTGPIPPNSTLYFVVELKAVS